MGASYRRDSDNDELSDRIEVEVVGSAPDTADTDGDGYKDGYEDANRKSQGLDPLWVDFKVSKVSYVTDYAKGAVAGDLWREDSIAWLAGNLTSGATSSIPIVGSIVGGLADVRDVIGSAIHADWVGSGFSAVGAVPGGDVVAIPGKAAKFVARNPELAAAVAATIVTLSKVPERSKSKPLRRSGKAGTTCKPPVPARRHCSNYRGAGPISTMLRGTQAQHSRQRTQRQVHWVARRRDIPCRSLSRKHERSEQAGPGVNRRLHGGLQQQGPDLRRLR